MIGLKYSIARLAIEDRAWNVLHLRYGLTRKRTLEEIGDAYGVTRERIRQIEKKARGRLARATLALADTYDALEQNAKLLGEPFGTSRQALLRRMKKVLAQIGDAPSMANRYQLVVILRAAHETYGKRWPNVTYLFCSLQPACTDHSGISAAMVAEAEARREWSYAELARHVLVQAGSPMHWHDVVQAAEALKRRKSLSPSTLFNMMQFRKDIFARVGPGTYGLVEWGMSDRPSNVDLIASYFKDKGCAAPYNEILQKVGIPQKIKPHSLQMSLDLNPRFYRSIDGDYGIRAWLPPRERQTLKIPRWQIESKESYERVVRAVDDGYDVDGIVARDSVL